MPDEPTERSPRLQSILAPLPGDSPVGTDVRYEDTFQELKGEVDAAQSASREANFGRIVALATTILTEQSKDLTTASYLGLGLLRTEGFNGVGEGLDAIRLLSETFWDDLYPPIGRMSARRNAIQLLVDRSHEWLDTYRPTASDAEYLAQMREGVLQLEAFAGEKMADEAPVFSRLLQILETKRIAAEKPVSAKTLADGGDTEGGESQGPAALQTPADAVASVMTAASFLRDKDRTSALPYRLARAARWGDLRMAPPNQDRKTQLPAFVEQRKTYLEGLLAKAEYDNAVNEVEVSFPVTPFWLDLQRYSHTAMEALGETFASARQAILEETALLIHRFPELQTLTFNKGEPFADSETQLWLDVRVRPVFGSGTSHADVPVAAGEGDQLEAQFDEARRILAGGDLEGALAHMAEGEASGEAGRDRFRRQLYVAALCRQGGRAAVARAVLEGLDAEIDRAGVSAWEPALALNAWTALHACYAALRRDSGKEEQPLLQKAAEHIVEKVARLAPRKALTLIDTK